MTTKTKTDPTGQRGNRERATRSIKSRLKAAERRVITLFRGIPRRRRVQAPITNVDTIVYDYDLPLDQLETLQADVRQIIDSELETIDDRVPPEWFYNPSVEQPYRQGTAEELIQFNQLIAVAVIAGALGRGGLPPQRIPIELVLTSPSYFQALNTVKVRNYTAIKSLSDKTAGQVIGQIESGLVAGNTPTQITAGVSERFDVAESSAKRIADTEVNWAYNRAGLDAVSLAAEESGLRAGVIHISALSTTTRSHHAARHGNAYTVEDQRAWWAQGSNLINCKCTTRSVLIDGKDNVVQREQQEKIKQEGEEFFGEG